MRLCFWEAKGRDWRVKWGGQRRGEDRGVILETRGAKRASIVGDRTGGGATRERGGEGERERES